MTLCHTDLPEVVLVDPPRFPDNRGWFEPLCTPEIGARLAGWRPFVQVNQSRSFRGVLRGMHLQPRRPQGKLVRVLSGTIFDVAVDLRVGSPTFGRWTGAALEAGGPGLWIPPGFAHGFYVPGGDASLLYLVTAPWDPGNELTLAWDDPAVGVDWPLGPGAPIVSDRDAAGLPLTQIWERLS